MPPLVTARVDERAVKLMCDWIRQLKPDKAIVREWQMEDLLPVLDQAKSGRSFASGQGAFRESGCVQCHRFAGEGGNVGPDLTGIGRRLAPRDLLESILLPSKVIADEYAAFEIETAGGEIVCGRIEKEDEEVLVLRPPASGEAPVEIKKKSIRRRERSQVSNMPAGMVNVLQKDEILDLLAYLLGEGDPKAR
jgi:putative heme-binding domain-containing protein